METFQFDDHDAGVWMGMSVNSEVSLEVRFALSFKTPLYFKARENALEQSSLLPKFQC